MNEDDVVAAASPAALAPDLLPTQQRVFAELTRIAAVSPLTLVSGNRGMGTSTILRRFAAMHDAPFVDSDDFRASWLGRAPGAPDVAIMTRLSKLLDQSDLLVIDDISIHSIGTAQRSFGREMQSTNLFNRARDLGKRIVSGYTPHVHVGGSQGRARWYQVEDLGSSDLREWLARRYGESAVAGIDFEQIERHFGSVDCYSMARLEFGSVPHGISTAQLTEELERVRGTANVVTGEVEALTFDTLPGTAHIAEQLETHVLLPLERPDLARDLDIRPKRGVLLYGPPGSGKTSIGRALAHRMGGRFFLIDGSIPVDPPVQFFGTVKAIVEQAKRHAPSVLFIDDADMLFGLVNITGIARYLLTVLDGLESEGAGKVCVMMTAMNATKIPAPILRSGRVELWLATNAPDVETRAQILKRWIGTDLPGYDQVDHAAVAAGLDGCMPADIRRVVGDARTHFAADSWAGRPVKDASSYLGIAVSDLVASRARMAKHLGDDSLRIGTMREAARKQASNSDSGR